MKFMTFVKVIVVLALCMVGVGFYQGWFVMSRTNPDGDSKKVNVQLTVDPEKVKDDAQAVKDKTKELAGKAADGAKDLGRKTRDAVKPESK